MPGYTMHFRCPCGFRRGNIMVGATERYDLPLMICRGCPRVFTIPVDGSHPRRRREDTHCRSCGEELLPVTAPGAWAPERLRRLFPDTDPWLIDEGSFDREPTAEDLADLERIRLLCPRCGRHTLGFESAGLWD